MLALAWTALALAAPPGELPVEVRGDAIAAVGAVGDAFVSRRDEGAVLVAWTADPVRLAATCVDPRGEAISTVTLWRESAAPPGIAEWHTVPSFPECAASGSKLVLHAADARPKRLLSPKADLLASNEPAVAATLPALPVGALGFGPRAGTADLRGVVFEGSAPLGARPERAPRRSVHFPAARPSLQGSCPTDEIAHAIEARAEAVQACDGRGEALLDLAFDPDGRLVRVAVGEADAYGIGGFRGGIGGLRAARAPEVTGAPCVAEALATIALPPLYAACRVTSWPVPQPFEGY